MVISTKARVKLVYKGENLSVFKAAFSGALRNASSLLSGNEPLVLLDSAAQSSTINRWSFLASKPSSIIGYKNGQIISSGSNALSSKKDPFNLLREFLIEDIDSEWQNLAFSPYVGGPIGFISYDGARYIEKIPLIAEDDLNLPDFYFMKPQSVLAHQIDTNTLFIYLYNQSNDFSEAEKIVDCLIDSKTDEGFFTSKKITSNYQEGEFEKAVEKIRNYIYAGDVYQVNLSQRFEKDFEGSSLSLYKQLIGINPSPFSAYLKGEDFDIISSSCERLISLAGKHAQTRPIAGTRRRGSSQKEDEFLSGHLLLDGKERAEHIMLVDLERNDLGKVCEYGSVHVDELMSLEKYSHVIHIVSNVCGKIHSKKDAFDLVKAMFPGGTITGCPKVRCMEIIEELEPTRRGPYTGSLGYFSYNNNIDFNILIRTIVRKEDKVYLQAGAGIVYDSVPRREYFETISKARALFESLGHNVREEKWETLSI